MVSETMWSSRDQGESVIVVMDANRSKASVDAVCWALKHVVRPKDTVVVLGILCELGRKTSCFPFHMGMGTAGICMLFLFIYLHILLVLHSLLFLAQFMIRL